MASKIVWSENAVEDLEKLKAYLESTWPPQVLSTFLNILVDRLRMLEEFPNIGRPSLRFPHRRRTVLTKHNLLIYSIQGKEILVESIFDTRQDPDKLNF